MLFKKKHVKLILEGRKTATRRLTGRYKLGRVYAVQEGWLYDKTRGYILTVRKHRQKRPKCRHKNAIFLKLAR